MILKGKTAIITGASRGIGRAISLTLAAQGANVALIYAGNETAAAEACEAARSLGVHAQAYCCDVSDFAAVKNTVTEIFTAFGGVEILVNNAGVTRDGLLMMMKEQDFDRVLDINLKGAFNMIRHVAPHFVKKRTGRIVNITSIAGLTGNAGQVNYSAAKAGMIGLTKSVARELASRGITCNAIAPGLIQTDMTDAMPEQARGAFLNEIPLKRMGTAEEVASLTAYLCGPHAGYITGEVIRIDGGLAM